jgi:hypothetical protein
MYDWGNSSSDSDPEFNDFNDLPRKEDLCPKGGGGHEYIQIYKTDIVEILKCKKCDHDSVGYFCDPWNIPKRRS